MHDDDRAFLLDALDVGSCGPYRLHETDPPEVCSFCGEVGFDCDVPFDEVSSCACGKGPVCSSRALEIGILLGR